MSLFWIFVVDVVLMFIEFGFVVICWILIGVVEVVGVVIMGGCVDSVVGWVVILLVNIVVENKLMISDIVNVLIFFIKFFCEKWLMNWSERYRCREKFVMSKNGIFEYIWKNRKKRLIFVVNLWIEKMNLIELKDLLIFWGKIVLIRKKFFKINKNFIFNLWNLIWVRMNVKNLFLVI